MNFIDPDLFFPISEGSLPWQPILGKIGEIVSLNTPAFRNGFEYSNFDLQVLNGNIFLLHFVQL